MSRFLLILLLLASFSPLRADDDVKEQFGEELFARYQDALRRQQAVPQSLTMEVLMEGKIPKLKKEGKMSAVKLVSGLGRVSWKMMGFWGDDTVKKEVMARYMQAEQDASNPSTEKKHDIGITPDNYNFKYKGLNNRADRVVHIFELKPKHKRLGLFKGELWIDPDTSLPVRETGRLVKNPSVFIKKMEFTRDYEIREGVAYLKRMESTTETRIVGKAQLNIEYAKVQKDEAPAEALSEARGAARLRP